MPNLKDNPRYNVVSLRISDEEMAELEEVKRRTRKSVSDILRDALELYSLQSGCVQKLERCR
ncbi:MAG: CopG family transcriptional regulator [Geobacter sp.]|nr:CopG family transcriptional regulator [Geobacter sp.]